MVSRVAEAPINVLGSSLPSASLWVCRLPWFVLGPVPTSPLLSWGALGECVCPCVHTCLGECMCPCVHTCVCPLCVLGAGIRALQWRRFYIPWSEFLVVLSLLVHSPVISSLPSQTGQCLLAPDWKRTEVGMEEGRRPDVTSHDVFVLRMPAWPCEVAQLVFLWGLLFFFYVVVKIGTWPPSPQPLMEGW